LDALVEAFAMVKRYLVLLLIPFAVGTAAFGVRRAGLLNMIRGQPILRMNRTVDLGEKPPRKVVPVEFALANDGWVPLEVSRIATDCGCMNVEQFVGGEYRAVTALTVPPRTSVALRAQLAVTGTKGTRVRRVVRFSTNDPEAPEAETEIVASVAAGLVSVPEHAILPAKPAGEAASAILLFLDEDPASAGQALRFASSAPERIRARALPRDQWPDALALPSFGKRVAVVEVLVTPPTGPGRFAGEIQVFDRDKHEPTLTIPVGVEWVTAVQAYPATLTLPRQTGDGPVYAGRCVCRGPDGKALNVAAESVPEGLRVRVEDAGPAQNNRLVNVEVVSPKTLPKEPVTRTLTLTARWDGGSQRLEIPVMCQRPE
jgi:hypothetical protein